MFRRISQEHRHFRIQDADRPRHACYFVHPVLFKYRGRWRVHLPRLCEWTRGSGEKQLGRTFKTHHRLHVHNVKFVPPKMPMLGDPHSLSQLFWSEFFLGWTLETHWWHHWLLLSINSHHFKSSKGFCPEQPWEKRNMPNLIFFMIMMKFESFIRSKWQTVHGLRIHACHDFQLDWFYFLLVEFDRFLCFCTCCAKQCG